MHETITLLGLTDNPFTYHIAFPFIRDVSVTPLVYTHTIIRLHGISDIPDTSGIDSYQIHFTWSQ